MENRGHDQWRRRLEALNKGLTPEQPVAALMDSPEPPPGPQYAPARQRSSLLAGLGLITLVGMLVIALLAAFPLAWERKAHPCSALESLMARQVYGWVPQTGTAAPSLVLMTNADLPGWFRCYVVYWRRLDVKPISGETLRRTMSGLDTSLAAYFLGGGLLLAALALFVRRRSRSSGGEAEEVFRLLGTDAKTAMARAVAPPAAPPPVDLSKPITGEAAWKAVRAYASDAAYQRAMETVRLRYQLVGNQMLLPNTLREAMGRSGLNFREAMLRVAEDDGVGRRR